MKKQLASILFWLTGATLLLLLSGCSTRIVDHVAPDGVRTHYRESQLFSKTALTGTVLGRESKTTKQLFGQKSSESEAAEEALAVFFNGMQGLFEAGVKAGAKAVIPVP